MAYQDVNSLDTDTVTALGGRNKTTGKNNPTEVEGYYLGSKKIESRRAKSGFSYIHVFQTPKGNIGVWGKTDMDRKILSVSPGNMTKVTFVGTAPTPNGDMFKFKVQHDPENSIPVAAPSEPSSGAGTSYGSFGAQDSDEDEDSGFDKEDDEEDEVRAKRKSDVQSILNRKRTA